MTMDSNLSDITDTERTAAATYGAIDNIMKAMDAALKERLAIVDAARQLNQRQLRERVLTAARMLLDAHDEGYEDWCLWDGLREAVRQEAGR